MQDKISATEAGCKNSSHAAAQNLCLCIMCVRPSALLSNKSYLTYSTCNRSIVIQLSGTGREKFIQF